MEPGIGPEVVAYQQAWKAAREAAAAATAEWSERTGDPLAMAVAEATAADSGAETFDDAFETVAAGILAGRSLDDTGAGDEHRLLRATLRQFADAQVLPLAQDIHRQDLDIPASIIDGVAELGLFGLSIPESYGGFRGERGDHVAMLIGTEELSAGSLAAGGSLMTRPEILVRALLSGGSEEQRRHWLPGIAAGKLLVAVSVTEADYGSDVASIQCRATRLGDGGWSLSGSKLWCTFAGRAQLLMVLCRTSGDDHRGLSLFVAEKPSEMGHEFEHRQPHGGFLRGRAIPTLGYRGLHTFELLFEDYRLPPTALVGAEGRGFYLQMEGFATGRLQTVGRAVGVMQAALRETVAYVKDRRIFGRPIAEHELARQMLGRMATRLHASRQLGHAVARRLDAEDAAAQVDAALAKLYASRMAEYVTRDAMQLFGGMGYGEESTVSRLFVDARVLAIFEGSEETLALKVIARALDSGRPGAGDRRPPSGRVEEGITT